MCDRCKRGWERSRYEMGYHKQACKEERDCRKARYHALSARADGARQGRKALVPRTPEGLLPFCFSFLLHNWLRSCSKYHQLSRLVGPHKTDTQYLGYYLPLCLVQQSIYKSPLLFNKCQRSADHELSHTAKNLLGAISVSGEFWSSLTVLRCLEKKRSYN